MHRRMTATLPELRDCQSRGLDTLRIGGVNPPKIAVALLWIRENPAVRTSAGMISVRNTISAPLELANRNESHNSTVISRLNDGAFISTTTPGKPSAAPAH